MRQRFQFDPGGSRLLVEMEIHQGEKPGRFTSGEKLSDRRREETILAVSSPARNSATDGLREPPCSFARKHIPGQGGTNLQTSTLSIPDTLRGLSSQGSPGLSAW